MLLQGLQRRIDLVAHSLKGGHLFRQIEELIQIRRLVPATTALCSARHTPDLGQRGGQLSLGLSLRGLCP
jgi:hypothetical protein